MKHSLSTSNATLRVVVVVVAVASLACGSVQNSPGDAAGACTVDALRCEGNQPQRCVNGAWQDQAACVTPRSTCSAGACVAPSCADGKQCSGIGCCDSYFLSGFNYPIGRSTMGSDAFANGKAQEVPEHTATVASFYLDALELSVGRFRAFVDVYDKIPRPADGAGAPPQGPRIGVASRLVGADAGATAWPPTCAKRTWPAAARGSRAG